MKHLIIVLTVFVLMLNISYSQYKYENPIYIKNNAPTSLTNAQVLIRFNTLTPVVWGWMQADGKDIAFTSACGATNYLQHWIDSYMLTDSTKIWVRVPYIGANDSTLIYLNFGNPNATNLSTFNVFDGPWSSTDSVILSSTSQQNNHQFGFRFTANNDLLITHFGKRVVDSTQRYVTLFDYNTQAILGQRYIDAGHPAQYNYNNLDSPLWLLQGHQYVICVFCGLSQFYYYGNTTQVSPYLTYIEMRHMFSASQNTFPTIAIPNMHYGCPDFLYWAKQNVTPAPTFTVLPSADTTTPSSPQNLTANLGALQVLLKWNKNSEYDVSKYNVYMNTEFNPSTSTLIGTVNQPDTTFLSTGLTSGTTYFFWVKSVDRYCNPKISPYSNVAICVPGNATYNLPELIYYKFKNNIYNPLSTPNFASTPVGQYFADIIGLTLGAGGEFDSCLSGNGTVGGSVITGWPWSMGSGLWTISFWVKDLANSGQVFLFGDNWADVFACYYGGSAGANNICFRSAYQGYLYRFNIITPCPMPGNQVFHFVYTGSQIRVYRNGVSVQDTIASFNTSPGSGLSVGGYLGTTQSLNGKMDEFRLFNRELSSNEISQTWIHCQQQQVILFRYHKTRILLRI